MGEPSGRSKTGRLLIVGGGGHAGVVIDALRSSGQADLLKDAGILDSHPDLISQGAAHGLPILGNDDFLKEAPSQGFGQFVLGLGGGVDNAKRRDLFDRAKASGLVPLSVVHGSAIVSETACLGPGNILFARSVVNANSTLGQNIIVNTAAVVEHDCRIDDHVHIAPRACLLGGATVEARALIGAGAIIRQGLTIGEGAIVGCGAVVIKNVAAGATVYGNPAA